MMAIDSEKRDKLLSEVRPIEKNNQGFQGKGHV